MTKILNRSGGPDPESGNLLGGHPGGGHPGESAVCCLLLLLYLRPWTGRNHPTPRSRLRILAGKSQSHCQNLGLKLL